MGASAAFADSTSNYYATTATYDWSTDWTIATWVYPTAQTNPRGIFSCDSTSTAPLHMKGTTTVENQIQGDGDYATSQATGVAVDAWAFVGCTHDLSAVQAGIGVGNASQVITITGTANYTGPPTVTDKVILFSQLTTGGYPMSGYIAYASMYNRVLSDAELQEIMYTPFSIRNGLWGGWMMMGSDPLADISGNGRDLTETGTVATNAAGPPVSFPRGLIG